MNPSCAALELPADVQACLSGVQGDGMRLAAELVVALARIYGARDLVPVRSVQVAGVSYRNLGPAGLDFLRHWAEQGGRVRIPSTLNPAGMDLRDWRAHGIPAEFARQQLAVIDAYQRLGVTPTCTCTPYLVGNVPGCGEAVAWSESSAVAFANSVLGARTNREGGPSALAAAMLGQTGRYGLQLDEGRRATLVVDVRCPLRSAADFGALGYLVGRMAGDGVPLLRLHRRPGDLVAGQDVMGHPCLPHLQALSAALAASGAVGLYHIEGVTPEAQTAADLIAPDATCAALDDLAPGYAALNTTTAPVDLVSIGCPHASVAELAAAAELLQGRPLRTELWITSARATFVEAQRRGILEPLRRSGARLLADTCLVVAPMRAYRYRVLATNSAKMATYAPGHCGLQTRFGTLEQCMGAAVRGEWA